MGGTFRKESGTISSSITQNLDRVRRRMAEAARRAGRSPDEVGLVAVTKHRETEIIREVIRSGQRVLGENRVPELLEKIRYFEEEPPERSALGDEGAAGGVEWHMIGHVQTNKAKKLVGKTALIHGVDSLRLIEALDRAAERLDGAVDILLQVNVSGEESKFGLGPEEAGGAARELRAFERVRCVGLMTMAPWEADPEATRPVFRALRDLRERLREKNYEWLDLRHLSMGMTNDFEVAVEEGATLVRVGTALFE